MTTVQRVVVGCVFVGLCSLGGMFSSLFCCSVLLMFPSMIGSQGRTFLMVYVLHGLYQVLHGKKVLNEHSVNIQFADMNLGNLSHEHLSSQNDSEEFQKEAQNVSKQFQKIRDEVMGQYGYDSLGKESVHTANSTQEEYVVKTRARCDYVVEQGISRCQDWFSVKWQECIDTIQAPLINHFLCILMHFHFLCDIMRVMTSWCTEKIPVEGNFGQTFDKLNDSINRLAEHFTTDVVLEKLEQQSVFGVDILQDFSKELSHVFQEKTIIAEKIPGGKRYLLPLKKAERESLINPWSSCLWYCMLLWSLCSAFNSCSDVQAVYLKRSRVKGEVCHFSFSYGTKKNWKCHVFKQIVGFLQVASLALFVCVLLAVDGILYNIFDLIRRHTFTTYSVTSVHHIDIVIGGDSIARLLRKTIGAFNTSSNLDVQSSNICDCGQ